jgi:hypothetical protein
MFTKQIHLFITNGLINLKKNFFVLLLLANINEVTFEWSYVLFIVRENFFKMHILYAYINIFAFVINIKLRV